MSELEDSIILANKVLDRINADPDDDLAVLARQLLRHQEWLRGRDNFIVSHGLWTEFVNSLPR